MLQVQELEEKLAALSDDLTAQRSAVESAQRSAGDAAQERIDELQAQVEETQIERDQMQTDVHSLQQQLHDQDRRYREVCSNRRLVYTVLKVNLLLTVPDSDVSHLSRYFKFANLLADRMLRSLFLKYLLRNHFTAVGC